MFGSLGFTEIAFILVLALLLFGPKRLPEIGRTIGKGLAEFRRASNELRRTLESEVALEENEAKRRPPAISPARPAAAPTVGATEAAAAAVAEETPPVEEAGTPPEPRPTQAEEPTASSPQPVPRDAGHAD